MQLIIVSMEHPQKPLARLRTPFATRLGNLDIFETEEQNQLFHQGLLQSQHFDVLFYGWC